MNDKTKNMDLSDSQLDQLLAHASTPQIPVDFEARLLAKISKPIDNVVIMPASNVIAFPQRAVKPKTNYWLAGLPLAASLVLGLWLGASDSAYLPFATDTLAQNVANLILPGSSDALDDLSEDNLS